MYCLLVPTQIINVGCHPASIRQLLQVVGSLMVPTDEDSQDWSLLLSRIISETKTVMLTFYILSLMSCTF